MADFAPLRTRAALETVASMRWLLALALLMLISAGCALETSSPPPRPVGQIAELNHVFAVVDQETAQAIDQSDFLRRFANIEIRTTIGTLSTWTGRYLYGRETYVEFFAPGDFQIARGPAPLGSWGIAISGDRVGDSTRLKSRIEELGLRAIVEIETRQFGDRKVPWFTAVTAVGQHGDTGARDEPVTIWAMEYVPSYLDLPEVGKEPAEGPHDVVSRERYQADLYVQKMMRDVTRVTFEVREQDYRRIEPMLRASGYKLSRSGQAMIADGKQSDFVFHLTETGMKLRSIEFALNAVSAAHVETIGRSCLVAGPGTTAVWSFN